MICLFHCYQVLFTFTSLLQLPCFCNSGRELNKKKLHFLFYTDATMSAARVSVVEAHGLSVNVPWAGLLIHQLWF